VTTEGGEQGEQTAMDRTGCDRSDRSRHLRVLTTSSPRSGQAAICCPYRSVRRSLSRGGEIRSPHHPSRPKPPLPIASLDHTTSAPPQTWVAPPLPLGPAPVRSRLSQANQGHRLGPAQGHPLQALEPPRVSWGLQTLRGWGHATTWEVPSRWKDVPGHVCTMSRDITEWS
jgi:hypothetical protein